MKQSELQEKVYALVAQAVPAKVADVPLNPSLSLRRDLGLDSLGLATLLFHFGEELGVDPEDLLEHLADEPVNTLADMVALGSRIERKAAEPSP